MRHDVVKLINHLLKISFSENLARIIFRIIQIISNFHNFAFAVNIIEFCLQIRQMFENRLNQTNAKIKIFLIFYMQNMRKYRLLRKCRISANTYDVAANLMDIAILYDKHERFKSFKLFKSFKS